MTTRKDYSYRLGSHPWKNQCTHGSIFTCPGFSFCYCKPHPKGNECHNIFCGESGILYGWDIV